VLKQREPINGKSVIPIYKNSKYGSSAALTTPIRITQKYDMYTSDVILTPKKGGEGGLFIKKGHSPTYAKTHTFKSGNKSSCGLCIPSYLARKYDHGISQPLPGANRRIKKTSLSKN